MSAGPYGALLDAVRGVRWPAARRVMGATLGAHPSQLRGNSSEFSEFRPYRQGDDPRRLDWRLLARSDRAYVRLTTDRATLRTSMLVDASAYYPKSAIIGGWVASNEYYAKHLDVMKRVVRAWVAANDYLVSKPDEALAAIQTKEYPEVPLDSLKAMYKASKVFSSKEWLKLYNDGTVTKWLNQVTHFYVEIGAIQKPLPAEEYFDPKLLRSVVGG